MRGVSAVLGLGILIASGFSPYSLRADEVYRTRIRFASVESAVRACDALPTVDDRTRCHHGNVNEYNRVRSSFWEQFWHTLHPVYREMIGEACIDGPITAGPTLERSYQCISRQIRSGRLRFSGTSDAVRLWDNFLRGHSGVVRSLGACRAHASGGSDAGHRTCGAEAELRLVETIPEPLSPMDATSVGAALVPSDERPGPGGASATSGSGGSASGAAETSAEAGSRFVDPEEADGATAGHCEAAIPDTSRRSAILRSHVMEACSERPAGARPESELNLFDPMVALSSQTYVDGLRRYTIQQLLTRYTESFGNDLSRRFDRSGGSCRVRRVPEGCGRNSDIMAEFNRVGCAEVDSAGIASDRRARRSDEYQRVTRARATEIRDLMRRGREVTDSISFAEGPEPRPPAGDSPGSAAVDLSYFEMRSRYRDTVTRLPQLREELDSIRNRVAAIQAAAPHLRLTRSELSDHAGDEWFVPSIVNSVADETNLTRIRESTERGYRELEEQMWGAVANACDPEQLTHEDLVLNPSIVNRFLAISPNRELYGDLQRCMAGQMDSANRTRSGLQLVTVAACGVIGFGLAGPAGVALGAGCGLASAGVSYADYGVASRRMEWVAQCRASVRSEEDALCTQAEYLEARQRFDEAVSALTIDAVSTVAFDFLLPGVGAALGRLRPDRIAEITAEINRARALPSAEAEAELARIARRLGSEGDEVAIDATRPMFSAEFPPLTGRGPALGDLGDAPIPLTRARPDDITPLARTEPIAVARPTSVTLPIEACCRRVTFPADTPVSYSALDPVDPYYAGRGVHRSRTPTSIEFTFSSPRVLESSFPEVRSVELSGRPLRARLDDELLARGIDPAGRVTLAGEGAMSQAYFLHPEIPPALERQWMESAATSADPAATVRNLRRAWAADSATEVVKVRRPDAFRGTLGPMEAANQLRRDLAVADIADQLADGARYRGAPLVEVLRWTSTEGELARGIVRQPVSRGPTVYQLQEAVDRIRAATAPGTRLTEEASRALEEARALLRDSRLDVDEAERRLGAIEEFYRRAHDPTVRFQRENSISFVGALDRSGAIHNAGLDFNHGHNVLWNSERGIFQIIDW